MRIVNVALFCSVWDCYFLLIITNFFAAFTNATVFTKSTHLPSTPEVNLTLCQTSIIRSSHRCSLKKGILKDFANFKGKHLCWSLFLIKRLLLAPIMRTSANDCFYIMNYRFLNAHLHYQT